MLHLQPFVLALLVVGFAPSRAELRGTVSKAEIKVTPVEKVIELLKNLQTQLEAESKTEAAQYDKYACFCKEQIDEKVYAIERSQEKIAELTTKINKLDKEIEVQNREIGQLSKDAADLALKIKDAAEKRAEAYAKYEAEAQDLSDGISALERAIDAMESSKDKMKDAKYEFVQLRTNAARVLEVVSSGNARVTPTEQQLKTVRVLAQMGQEPEVYEYHSEDIIATLEDLLKTFTQNKKDLDLEEFEAKSAFDTRDLDMKNEKKFIEKDIDEKSKIAAYKSEVMEGDQADKDKETQEMTADVEFRAVLVNDCEQKAALWDQRSTMRAGELTAIAEALELLASKVKPDYEANKKLVDLELHVAAAPATARRAPAAAAARAASFLQLRGAGELAAGTAVARRAVALLAASAKSLHSRVLSLAILKAEAAEDHFVKVRSIIKDIIDKLAADAEAEANTKSFCDKSMAESIDSRDKANADIEKLKGSLARSESQVETLTAEIGQLSEDIATLKKGLLEATELRNGESAENKETIATATEGKSAVEMALDVLKEFYGDAKTAMVQYVPPNSDREGKTVGDLAPEIFEGKYRGEQAASTGIMGLLEVILSDFKRTIEAVTAEEKNQEDAFQQLKKDAETSITKKEHAKSTKEATVTTLNDSIIQLNNSLKEKQSLLDSALALLSALSKDCVDGEETYEQRVAKREQEVEALKQALAILEDWQN